MILCSVIFVLVSGTRLFLEGDDVKAENFKNCLACFGRLLGAFKNVRVIPGILLKLWESFCNFL